MGEEGMEVGEEGECIPIATRTVTTRMICIKMGSDESHFNVSPVIVRDKVTTETVSTDHNFWRERRAEAVSNRGPSAYQPTALPLGQTGSQGLCLMMMMKARH